MKATTILGIIAIVAAFDAVTLLVRIQEVSAQEACPGGKPITENGRLVCLNPGGGYSNPYPGGFGGH